MASKICEMPQSACGAFKEEDVHTERTWGAARPSGFLVGRNPRSFSAMSTGGRVSPFTFATEVSTLSFGLTLADVSTTVLRFPSGFFDSALSYWKLGSALLLLWTFRLLSLASVTVVETGQRLSITSFSVRASRRCASEFGRLRSYYRNLVT
jgi:hypothetical protein